MSFRRTRKRSFSYIQNKGFEKGLNYHDVFVFGVSGGGGDFAYINKNSPPRSNSTPIVIIQPFNTRFRFPTWLFGLMGSLSDILMAKSAKATKTGQIVQVGPRGGGGVMRELTYFLV
jgi:hypothetical protein